MSAAIQRYNRAAKLKERGVEVEDPRRAARARTPHRLPYYLNNKMFL